MELSGIIWMLFPLLGIILLAILRPNRSISGKEILKGLIIAGIIIGTYTLWRLSQGGL